MSETIVGEAVSVVMVQIAAVSFIVVPMFEMTLPIHKARNNGKRRGDQADIASSIHAPLQIANAEFQSTI
jgi:hypothetical protein